MAEGSIGLPLDGAGKQLRTLTGGTAQPAGTHQEVDSLAHPDGTLVVVGAGLPVALDVNGQLAALLTELGQKLEPGQAVALDAATLAALESITAAVTGTVAVSNLPATQPVSGPLTDTQLRATALPVSADTLTTIAAALDNRFGGGKTAVPFTVTAAGDTTIYTPAAGKAVRLFSVSALADSDQATTPLIKVLLGSVEVTRGHAIGDWEIREGAANGALKLNLSEANSVSGTVYLKEFTP